MSSSVQSNSAWWLCGAGLWLLAGCNQHYVEVEEVLNHNACKGLVRGAQIVSPTILPQLRGSKLLQLRPTDSTPQQLQMTEGVLVAVSNGEQPSAGYSLSLATATLTDAHLTLNYQWHTPTPQHKYTQAITAPCSVVAIPPANVARVTVNLKGTLQEEVLTELTISSPAAQQ